MELTTTESCSNQWLPRKRQLYRYMPEEIVVNILPNLPPKSLTRFRCVSKLWRRLISKIKTYKLLFMSERPHHAIKEPNGDFVYTFSTVDHKKVVKRIGQYRPPESPCYIPSIPSRVPWLTNKTLPKTHLVPRIPGDIEFMGSCNNLVLLREDSDLILWNPTTSHRKRVLSHPKLGGRESCVAASGLCFDSHSNSYKAVFSRAYSCGCCGPDIVAVGCCKSKSWKEIGFPYKINYVHSGPVCNDRLHWYVTTGRSRSFPPYLIIYFDALSDKFVNFPMPEPVGPDGDVFFGLGVLDGYLCMTRLEERADLYVSKGTAQVLVMKEYGVKESWTLLFKLKEVYIPWGIEPYFYCQKKGEVLMKARGLYSGHSGYDLVAYYSDTNTRVEVATLNRCGDAIVFEETYARPF